MYFYLKDSKSKSESLIIIRFHIGKGKDRFVYSTGENIAPKDWNYELKSVKQNKKGVKYAALRKQLNKYSEYLDTLIATYKLNGIDITKKLLKNNFDIKFKGKKIVKKNVLAYFDEMIEERKSINFAKNTIIKYQTMKNYLIRYENYLDRKLTFNDFDNNFFKRWISFAYEVLKISDNTINRQGSYFRTFLKETKDKGLHNITDYKQFVNLEKETDHISLTKKEIFEILNFDFKNESQQRVIDMFLVGCFTGQRFCDYSIFDKTDYINGRIEKRAIKTKIKTIIPVDNNIHLKNLLEKYDWQLPIISNQKFNDILKKALCKIESLDIDIKKNSYQGSKTNTKILKKWQMCGSHTARRTFITICLEDGWTYKEVMTVAGIKKVETLMKYDKISYDRLDKKAKNTWC